MSSSAGSSDRAEDFPGCWTSAAVIAELQRILTGQKFKNDVLHRIAAEILEGMSRNPTSFAQGGIETNVPSGAIAYKRMLFMQLELANIEIYPRDRPRRADGVAIWAIGLEDKDLRYWEDERQKHID